MSMIWRRTVWVWCVLTVVGGAAQAELEGGSRVASRDVGRLAAIQGKVTVEDIRYADTGDVVAFDLERFEVFTPDAKVTVHGSFGDEELAPPANAYFRGVVAGRPDGSRVFLTVLPDGTVQGVVTEGEESFLIGPENDLGGEAAQPSRLPLEMHRVDLRSLEASRGEGFECGNNLLPPGRTTLEGLEGLDLAAGEAAAPAPAAAEIAASYTARVAIETDYEFYAKFNNATAATTYAGNLIGYASTLYAAEVNTGLAVQSVSLWSTNSDPWVQTTGLCGLMEFGRYWNRNKTDVSRTIAHFLSGRSTGGGVAWIGVLCSGSFGASANCPGLGTDAPWGGGYGFTGNLTGTFNVNNPAVMWDILAVSHEIGHNFNSPHTHCYNGLEGNASPVDQCYGGESGCYAGTQGLPGPGGVGSGTIMSYCHLLGGGYSNVALTFGTNHPYGVQPGRVPSRMSAHVAAKAASSPSCLAPMSMAGSVIFFDGLESGVVPGAWSGQRSGS